MNKPTNQRRDALFTTPSLPLMFMPDRRDLPAVVKSLEDPPRASGSSLDQGTPTTPPFLEAMPEPRPGTFVFFWFLFILPSTGVFSIKWLALSRLSSVATIANEATCERLSGLMNRQVAICKRNLEVMGSVREGALTAIEECHYQFRTRRWNCSILQDGRLLTGTREAAFVHAVSAAGVAHAVTKACSTGELDKCGCDRSVRGTASEGFQWSGCSDNVAFGTAFSRAFVDARESRGSKKARSSLRSLMNLHNNEAGRQILESNMRIECKCHGVSGSCELKTCWRAMPTFRQVGRILKDKFDGATEVEQRKLGSRRELIPLNPYFKPHTAIDLVYVSRSPDFCEYDAKSGSLGTHGRLCNRTSKGVEGCDLLCCGRGFRTRKERVEERCSCKFYWCCYVKCKKCIREVEVSNCL